VENIYPGAAAHTRRMGETGFRWSARRAI